MLKGHFLLLFCLLFLHTPWVRSQHDSHSGPKLAIVSSNNDLDILDLQNGLSTKLPKVLSSDEIVLGIRSTADHLQTVYRSKDLKVVYRQSNGDDLEKTQILFDLKTENNESQMHIESIHLEDGEIFFYDSISSTIYRSNLTTKDSVVIIRTENIVTTMTYDPCEMLLFYSTGKSIYRHSFSANKTIQIIGGLKSTRSIYLDPFTRKLYWTSKSTKVAKLNVLFKLERSDIDGSNREVVCESPSDKSIPVKSIVIDSRNVYIADWQNLVLWKMEKEIDHVCNLDVLKSFQPAKPLAMSIFLPNVDVCALNIDIVQLQESTTGTSSKDRENGEQLDNPCNNYCYTTSTSNFQVPKCTLDETGEPKCSCPREFSGKRCEIDLCHNLCLNKGICQFDGTKNIPVCKCTDGFAGDRCNIRIDTGLSPLISSNGDNTTVPTPNKKDDVIADSHDYFVAFVVSLILCIILVVILAMVMSFISRSKRPLPIVIVRKPPETKNFDFRSGINSRRDPEPRSVPTPSGGPEACVNYGVVLDLEECCQMTICDQPCVEAIFRKPTQRKNRTISCHTDKETDVLIDNQSIAS